MANTKFSLTLSTTDFNLVGDIKVRQADDLTQTFSVKVIEHGLDKAFLGLKPFFCLMAREVTGQGVSEEPVQIFDASKGTLEYTLSANAMQMVGKNEAYFSFRKELSNGTWAEQFSTRSFFYTVEKSIYTQPFKDSNYWYTFKELYTKFIEYQNSGKSSWEDFLQSNRDVLESIDPGGVLLSEIIRSRKPEEADVAFDDLPTRLDKQVGLDSEFRTFEFNASFMKRVFNENYERGANVKWYGAKGDGITNDRIAIQNALNQAKGSLFFPPGKYVVEGELPYLLELNQNLNLIGLTTKGVEIIVRGTINPDTSVLKVSISNNEENLDVRNWKMENIGIYFDAQVVAEKGMHAVVFEDGFQLHSSRILNCSLFGRSVNKGKAIFANRKLSHSKISGCTLGPIVMKCFDANVIENNLFLGNEVACTYDLEVGVYNNTFRDNTISNRDGAVHIVNGDVIRIENNQIELAQGQGTSQSPVKSMVWAQGVDRPIKNLVISGNNFGGGTNLDNLIYLDNCEKTVVEKNQLISTNNSEVYLTEKTKYCQIARDNFTRPTISNPRPDRHIKAKIIDLGEGNMGTKKNLLSYSNGWKEGLMTKNQDGLVIFVEPLNAGSTAINSTIATLPLGFRPPRDIFVQSSSFAGECVLKISSSTGLITATTAIPSNSWLLPGVFSANAEPL